MDDALDVVREVSAPGERRPAVPHREGAVREGNVFLAGCGRVVPSLGGFGAGCLEQAVHGDLDRSVPVGLHAAAAAFLAGDFHLPQRDDAAPAVFFDPGRCDKLRQPHPLLEGHLYLVAEGGHVLTATPIENHGLAAEPDDAARHVDGRVATAYDGGDSRDGRLLAVADVFEELKPVADTFHLFAGYAKRRRFGMAAGEIDCPVGFFEVFQEIGRHGPARVDPDAMSLDLGDLPAQGGKGQPVERNPPAQNPAGLGGCLEDIAGVSQLCEKPGCRQPRGTCTGHGHLLGRAGAFPGELSGRCARPCRPGSARANGWRWGRRIPRGCRRPRRGGNRPARRRPGRGFPEDRLPGLLEEALGGEHLDPADVFPGRAGGAAGRRLFLVAGPQVAPGARLVGFRGLGRAGHDVNGAFRNRPGLCFLYHRIHLEKRSWCEKNRVAGAPHAAGLTA